MDLEDIFSQPVKPKTGGLVTAADGHTYHKSSSANATEAPTNQGTHDALDAKVSAVGTGLNDWELDFLMMCQMYHNVHGKLIEPEVAEKRYGVTPEMFSNTIELPHVQAALIKNGILRPPSESLMPRDSVLTPREIIVANTMLDLLDTRSDKKKLQDLSMSTAEYQRLLRKPAFQHYLMEMSESGLRHGQHEAALALMDKVRQGDLKAIAYYNEYMGKFTPNSGKSGGTTVNVGSQSSPDMHFIITRLIEIVTEEVTDLDTAARIGDRVKMLIGASRMATEMVEAQAEVVVPQVAAMRSQSDVITAIEKRAGVNKDA